MGTTDKADANLLDYLVPKEECTADTLLDAFLEWTVARGLTLYSAQEEAILEVMAGNHVVLNTPTGSGKSLVATAMHFRSLCVGLRSVYTCPIKALVSEKFFEACALFGADNVGMLTGDASINRDAPVLCCTAEILSNMALAQGDSADVDYVIMDEFHYYSDPERGIAWQVPLLSLRHVRFLLMSATLGDMSTIIEGIEQLTERPVTHVRSSERPVPLEFLYREEPLHEVLEEQVGQEKTPVYVVNFTQREATELTQSLTSTNFSSKEEKAAISAEIGDFRFDSPFGKDIKRYVHHGVGLHHAGLLPRYRRLVERLAQAGMLKVICGTDTLGVGINVPIRSVLFTKLCKYDGSKVGLLSVRDFKQISGRAGRKGFDTQGSVVCLAPAHVIENRKLQAKQNAGGKKKIVLKKPPDKGFASWDEKTFDRLIRSEPEALVSRFRITHGMLIQLLTESNENLKTRGGGYRRLMVLIERCHERPKVKRQLRRESRDLLRSLRDAEVVEVVRGPVNEPPVLRVHGDLQADFSLHHTLSLYLLDTLARLNSEEEGYALTVMSLVESVLEHPMVVLYAQEKKARGELIGRLKAEGMDYDERMVEVEKVTWPKPEAELIYETFNAFAERHPWVGENIRPKSVARDMYERYLSFPEYIREYGLSRSEGVLLRYLSEAYKVLVQTVPEQLKTDELIELQAFLRTTLERIDSSLVQEWEALTAPVDPAKPDAPPPPPDISRDKRAFEARIRQELHAVVRALAAEDYEEAEACTHPESDLEARAYEGALAAFHEEYGNVCFDYRARRTDKTQIEREAQHLWRIRQVLVDREEDNQWFIEGHVDLRDDTSPEGLLIRIERVAH